MPTQGLENQINELSKIMSDLHLYFTRPTLCIENCDNNVYNAIRYEWINPKAKELYETCTEFIVYLQKELHGYSD